MVIVLIYILAQTGSGVGKSLITLVVIPCAIKRKTHGIIACCKVENEGVIQSCNSIRCPSLVFGQSCIHNKCGVTDHIVLSLRSYVEVTLYFEHLTGFVDNINSTSFSQFEANVRIFIRIDTGSGVCQVLNAPPLVILGDEFELVRTGCEVQRQCIAVGYECTLLRPGAVSFAYDVFSTGNPELSNRCYIEVTFELEKFVGINHIHCTSLSQREDDIVILIGAQAVCLNSQLIITLSGAPSTIYRYFQFIVTGCEVQNEGVVLSLYSIRMPLQFSTYQCTVTRDVILSRNNRSRNRI